jgi:hypothetical protein
MSDLVTFIIDHLEKVSYGTKKLSFDDGTTNFKFVAGGCDLLPIFDHSIDHLYDVLFNKKWTDLTINENKNVLGLESLIRIFKKNFNEISEIYANGEILNFSLEHFISFSSKKIPTFKLITFCPIFGK